MREIVIRIPSSPRRRWLYSAMGALLCVGAAAYAMVPNTFNTGDALSAAKVNANFTNLDGRVTTLETVQPMQVPTFGSGWSNYDPGDSPLGYFKDPFGVVHLRGIIKEPTNAHGTAFTFPAGNRPAKTLVLGVLCGTNGGNSVALGLAYIQPSGVVVFDMGTCTTSNYVSLESITFRAEQ